MNQQTDNAIAKLSPSELDLTQTAELVRLRTENEALMVWGKRIYSYYLNHMQDWELALLLEEAPMCIKSDFFAEIAADLGISVEELVKHTAENVRDE